MTSSTAWSAPDHYVAFAPSDKILERIANMTDTPVWCYSLDMLDENIGLWVEESKAAGIRLSYSIKANPHQQIIELLHGSGMHFDIVSSGEMEHLLALGVAPEQIQFLGVGKTKQDMIAAIKKGVRLVVESESEWHELATLLRRRRKRIDVSMRVNLASLIADTQPQWQTTGQHAKFGVLDSAARQLLAEQHPHIRATELYAHLGSAIAKPKIYARALAALGDLAESASHPIQLLDMGGGFALNTSPQQAISYLSDGVDQSAMPYRLGISPGRALVAGCGALLTRVLRTKTTQTTRFAIVDAGMNALVRPAMYQARHPIAKVHDTDAAPADWEVCGPICESTDTFFSHRLPHNLKSGDLLCISEVGAYGEVMSSNYNLLPFAGSVLVAGKSIARITKSQKTKQMYGRFTRRTSV